MSDDLDRPDETGEIPHVVLTREDFDAIARAALAEDGAHEDVTARAFLPPTRNIHAVIRANRDGVIAGLTGVLAVLRAVSPRNAFTRLVQEGDAVVAGTEVAALGGPAREILAAERTALNLLGRLSGVATLARAFVDAVDGTGVTVHTTRKTTPGLRAFELWAATLGGARPHRTGLHEAVLAKENHFRAAGRPFDEVLRQARQTVPDGMFFATEVETIGELCHALEAGVDLVLLDDFPVEQVRRAVEERAARGLGRRPLFEASGGIDIANVRAYAETGIERVSVGAITHSAPWLDVSLDVVDEPRA